VRSFAFAFALVLMFAFAIAVARAEPTVLKLATVAPDGTAWAREVKAFNHDLDALTAGQLQTKWYFSGIAGDELDMLARARKGQLDGAVGAQLCERLAPSLRAARVLGLFQSHDEAIYAVAKLRPLVDKEFLASGFTSLGVGSGFGETILFTRTPVRTLAELRHLRLWLWDIDDVPKQQLAAMGITPVPTPLSEAGRAYDQGKSDGFLTVPTGALAFQWSTQARYFSELRAGFLPACVVLTNAAYDALSVDEQRALQKAADRLIARFDELGVSQDLALLGGLFERQGLHRVPVSEAFRAEFIDAARAAREHQGAKLAPPAVVQKLAGWVDEYRALHRRQGASR
jgi:TRAP-type C4-dicarboxylate transport system substrate-binding protein